ncbi:hypothetical protein DL768_011611 [Monosporascus sp. mg162]|nr:hypothetical protein DL768_011611 [Monosporascus sp. mg162]
MRPKLSPILELRVLEEVDNGSIFARARGPGGLDSPPRSWAEAMGDRCGGYPIATRYPTETQDCDEDDGAESMLAIMRANFVMQRASNGLGEYGRRVYFNSLSDCDESANPQHIVSPSWDTSTRVLPHHRSFYASWILMKEFVMLPELKS